MNVHGGVDRLTARLGGVFARRDRFFARELESPPLAEVIRRTRLEVPPPEGQAASEFTATTPVGELDAGYRTARWLGPAAPTLIYLQGSGERAFDFSARGKNTFRSVLLDAVPPVPANLIVVRAPFHGGSQRDYARAMGRLGNFTAMLAVLVHTAEGLITHLRGIERGPVLLTGISLGGWAANLHATYLGGADLYAPLLAGTALAELFLDSSYRHMTAADALNQPDLLRAVLNFEADFAARAPARRVRPLLARHDQFIRCERQTASYGGLPVALIGRGHVTAAASPALLRRHLEDALEALRGGQAPGGQTPDGLTTATS
jgi:hypothetical protein